LQEKQETKAMKFRSFLRARRLTAKHTHRPSRRLFFECLEDRVVPSILDGTILVCTGPSSFSTQDQSSFPVGIIGVNPNTGAQFPVSINSSQDGNLFVLPTYVTEGPNGQLYVTDLQAFGTGAVIRVDPNTGQQFLVSQGGLLNGPSVLAWVNGYLYVANEADGSGAVHTIVQVDPNNGAQKLITNGSSGPGFTVPVGMTPAPGNNIYVADEPGGYTGTQPGGIWEVNLMTGQQTLVTWGNLIDHPVDVTQDRNGNLIVIGNAVADPPTQRAQIVRVNPVIPSAQGSNQSLVFTEPSGYPLDGITENLNTGVLYTGSISYGTNPAELFAINPATQTQTTTTTGGQLSLVEGVHVYHSVVQAAATVTTVTASVPAPVCGQNVTFTATVSPQNPGGGTPTGTVQFQIDDVDAGGAVSVRTSAGVTTASFSTSILGIGTHTITARYGGDSTFTSSSGTLSGGAVVDKASTQTMVVTSFNPSLTGQTVTFTATVTVDAPGSTAVASPTGLVVFFDNGISIGQGNLHTAGLVTVASFSTNGLTAGRHQITAAYMSGDANFNASPTSAAIIQNVLQDGGTGGGGGILLGQPLTAVASTPNPTLPPNQPVQPAAQLPLVSAAPSEASILSGSAETDSITVRIAGIDDIFTDRSSGLSSD
jgi:hypothetical protein